MNPNSPQPEFTEKALDAKFSFSFSRKQLIILVNVLRPLELKLGDIRGRVLLEVLDEIERTAIQSITPDDYIKPETLTPTNHVVTPAEEVKTN